MYVDTDVNKKLGAGVGAPAPKKPNVIVMRSGDILTWPIRDSKGVKLLGDFVMKDGAKMIKVYMTPSKQSLSFDPEGDEDTIGFAPKFEGMFPGDTLEVNEFVQNWLGEDIVMIDESCSDDFSRVLGTECSPMKLKPGFKSDNSGRMHTLSFEQYTRTGVVPGFYYGNTSFGDPAATDFTIDVLVATGYQYKVDASALADAITINSIDLAHGAYVTLIGSGGVDPATLANGVSTAATVILKDGTAWTALEDATITFRVVDAGATIYLVEENRS